MDNDLTLISPRRHRLLLDDLVIREIAFMPGWWSLLDKLCQSLQGYLDDGLCQSLANYLHENAEVPLVVVRQIKEKFGGLRFYYGGGDGWCRAAVDDAQEVSLSICEVCGRPGELVGNRWVSVRCDEHTNWSAVEQVASGDADENDRKKRD